MGMNPNDQKNGGCSAVRDLLVDIDWECPKYDPWSRTEKRKNRDIDTDEARRKIKEIHLLAKYGARWVPEDRSEMNFIRRSLIKMTPDYTVEFIWIMAKNQACTRDAISDLLRTPAIKAVVKR
jgi:hypothetical protein